FFGAAGFLAAVVRLAAAAFVVAGVFAFAAAGFFAAGRRRVAAAGFAGVASSAAAFGTSAVTRPGLSAPDSLGVPRVGLCFIGSLLASAGTRQRLPRPAQSIWLASCEAQGYVRGLARVLARVEIVHRERPGGGDRLVAARRDVLIGHDALHREVVAS